MQLAARPGQLLCGESEQIVLDVPQLVGTGAVLLALGWLRCQPGVEQAQLAQVLRVGPHEFRVDVLLDGGGRERLLHAGERKVDLLQQLGLADPADDLVGADEPLQQQEHALVARLL